VFDMILNVQHCACVDMILNVQHCACVRHDFNCATLRVLDIVLNVQHCLRTTWFQMCNTVLAFDMILNVQHCIFQCWTTSACLLSAGIVTSLEDSRPRRSNSCSWSWNGWFDSSESETLFEYVSIQCNWTGVF